MIRKTRTAADQLAVMDAMLVTLKAMSLCAEDLLAYAHAKDLAGEAAEIREMEGESDADGINEWEVLEMQLQCALDDSRDDTYDYYEKVREYAAVMYGDLLNPPA